jgi:hypothetical protein
MRTENLHTTCTIILFREFSTDTRHVKNLLYLKARLVACFKALSITVLFLSPTDSLSNSFMLHTHRLLQNCNLLLVKHTQKEVVLARLTSCETGKGM